MRLIDMDRLRKELMAKGDIPIHEVFNTIWDQPIVNICEDCIRRKDAVRIASINSMPVDECVKMIKALPSVTPKPCEEENPNCTECRYYDKEKYHCPRFCKVIENTMAEITSEQTRWIPVSERLPEESLNSVIGWDAYRERCVFVQYIDGYFQIMGSAESFDIVAWMPLPEPYRESEE